MPPKRKERTDGFRDEFHEILNRTDWSLKTGWGRKATEQVASLGRQVEIERGDFDEDTCPDVLTMPVTELKVLGRSQRRRRVG